MKKRIFLFLIIAFTSHITAQVGIGTDIPDNYAILDVVSSNQGILIPRVDLTSENYDLNPDGDNDISNQPESLMVYNKGGSPTSLPNGYYFWNGQEWRMVSNKTSVAANATFSCNEATLDPEQLIKGDGTVILTGTVIRLPYTLGNGGIYNGVILESTGNSNLKATIANGQFENGSGYIALYLEGTPSAAQATPTGITFDLTPFYDANPSITKGCASITVGTEVKADIRSAAVMDNLKLVNDPFPLYAAQLTTPDGKFTIRAYIVSSDYHGSAATFGTDSEYGMNLLIKNNTNTNVIIAGQFNWQWGGTGGNGQNKLILQPGKWSGDNQANNTGEVYAGYLANGAGTLCSAPSTVTTNTCTFAYWGNNGVYAGSMPERRTYSWTINDDGTDKTAYILTFSSSALRPDDKANASTCLNGICSQTKVFMMVDQIIAE